MAPSICLVIRFVSKIFSLILLAHTYGSDPKFQITKNLISLPKSELLAVVCVLRDVYDWPKFLNYDQSHASYTCGWQIIRAWSSVIDNNTSFLIVSDVFEKSMARKATPTPFDKIFYDVKFFFAILQKNTCSFFMIKKVDNELTGVCVASAWINVGTF